MFIIWDPVVLNTFYTQQLNMVLSYLLGPKSWLFVKQLTSAFTRTFGIKLMQISSRSSLNVITPSSSHCLVGVCGHSWPVRSPGGELCPTSRSWGCVWRVELPCDQQLHLLGGSQVSEKLQLMACVALPRSVLTLGISPNKREGGELCCIT